MISLLMPLLAVTAPVQDAPDPLAPAREGKIRCIAPNLANRTCRTIVRYTPRGASGFDAEVLGIVERAPVVVIQYSTFGQVEAGGICTLVRITDFEKGRLLRSGPAVTRAQERALRLRLINAAQPLHGRKRCYLDRAGDQRDGTMPSTVTIDGVVRPELEQTVAWVAADAGFVLGL